MQETAVSFDRVGQAATVQPIPLDFEEGQQVTLLAGARINGLTTRFRSERPSVNRLPEEAR